MKMRCDVDSFFFPLYLFIFELFIFFILFYSFISFAKWNRGWWWCRRRRTKLSITKIRFFIYFFPCSPITCIYFYTFILFFCLTKTFSLYYAHLLFHNFVCGVLSADESVKERKREWERIEYAKVGVWIGRVAKNDKITFHLNS